MSSVVLPFENASIRARDRAPVPLEVEYAQPEKSLHAVSFGLTYGPTLTQCELLYRTPDFACVNYPVLDLEKQILPPDAPYTIHTYPVIFCWPGYPPQLLQLGRGLPDNPTRLEILNELAQKLNFRALQFQRIAPKPVYHPQRPNDPLPYSQYKHWDLSKIEYFSGNVCIGAFRLIELKRDNHLYGPVWVVDLAVDKMMISAKPEDDMAVQSFRLVMLSGAEWYWTIADCSNDPDYAELYEKAVPLT